MTLTILKQWQSDKTCDTHHIPMQEVIVRGTTIENDWKLTICPHCMDERIAAGHTTKDDA